MKNRRCFVLTAALVLLAVQIVLFFPAMAVSQIPGTAQKPAEQPPVEEPKGPQPIPASQISIKSQETAEVLRRLRERPDPDPEIQKINEALPAVLGELQELLTETRNRLKGTVSARDLEDLERRWSRHKDYVDGWQSTVNRRAQNLDGDLQTLQELRASWEITQESAGETGLQDALLEVVKSSLASIKEADKRFNGRRSEILVVQEQVVNATEIVRDALDQIESARTRTQLKLIQADSPPFWEIVADPPPHVQHWQNIVNAWEESEQDFHDFVGAYKNSLIVHALSFFFLFAVLLLLGRRARAADLEGPDLIASKRVLSRPLSTTATLWILITLLAYREAPQLVDEMATLVLFVPLYRILPTDTYKKAGGLLAALVVVNIFGRFVDLLTYLSPAYRLALLVESTMPSPWRAKSRRRGAN
jgi:hypothetical protein